MTRHLLDSSVWLAAAVSGHEHHSVARTWLETVAPPDSLYFCRSTQQTFLRVLTTGAFHAQFDDVSLTNERAWDVYDRLLADDRIFLQASEPDGIYRYWRAYSSRGTASPKLWMDAYLAAFAKAGGYRLVTLDAAFRQFEDLDLLVLGFPAGT